MSIKDFVSQLKNLFPVFYMFPYTDENNPPPTPPYICYVPSKDYVFADNSNFQSIETLTVEYYFEIKDTEQETKLENKLIELGYTFTRSEDTFIDDRFVIYYYLS